jgi:hypothetical protein
VTAEHLSAHMVPMLITPDQIDLGPVVQAALKGVLESQGALEATPWETIDGGLKARLGQNILPYLHQALPSILDQVNALSQSEDGVPVLHVPDTLEGLC